MVNKKNRNKSGFGMLGFLSLVKRLVGNSKFFTTFSSSGSKNATTIFGSHPTAETMFVSSFAG
jgi:hypothetical protein